MKINMTRDEILLTFGVGIGAAVVGGVIGYLYAMKKAWEEVAEDGLEAMDRMSSLVEEQVQNENQRSFKEELVEYNQMIVERGYRAHEIPDASPATMAKELRLWGLNNDEPYPISIDEFLDNEPDYDQLLLRWYDLDNVLTTHDEDVADDSLFNDIGRHNLEVYGYLPPPEQDSLYVRNDQTRYQYEIIRQNGAYCEKVLGERYDGPRESSPVIVPDQEE